MKIAAQSQLQLQGGADFLLQLREEPGKVFAIVGVTVVGVGSGDSVGDAVGRCHAAHFDGYIPRFGAVVDLGQKMAVDVDHNVGFISISTFTFNFTWNTTD